MNWCHCEGARSSKASHLEERRDPEKEERGEETEGEYSALDCFTQLLKLKDNVPR